jgi:hypothetical protein
MNLSSSVDDGANISPSVSISSKNKEKDQSVSSLGSSLSLGFNSRTGLQNLNLSASYSRNQKDYSYKGKNLGDGKLSSSLSGSISFNNTSYTPSKRVGYTNKNFNYSAAVGGEVFGVEGQVQVTGYGSYQNISDEYKNKDLAAFGYDNTHYKGNSNGVLDFNRENETTIDSRTTVLPTTNYTYDLYSIEGQWVSGSFRPSRSQVGFVYNDNVVDVGSGNNAGIEVGLGNLVHGSGDFSSNSSFSYTGVWSNNNFALPYFSESKLDKNDIKYESVYYRQIGNMAIDPDQNLYENKLYKKDVLALSFVGGNKNSYTEAKFLKTNPYTYNSTTPVNISEKIKRKERIRRSQLIQKISVKDAANDRFVKINSTILNNVHKYKHHTAGFKVLKTDGSTYVFGEAAYNITKKEISFDVSKSQDISSSDLKKGLVPYNGSFRDNDYSNSDEYLNIIETPKHAHSYLITSVLSSDYEDIDDNGPSKNDLGTYTKFEYSQPSTYKWRVPFESNKASYNPGLNSKKNDQKANVLYGEKENVYLNRIITKTHVAFFDLSDRKDAIGVTGEHGGAGSDRMKKIKTIRLYSLPEVTNSNGVITDPGVNGSIKPIKTAHFVYNYSLCKGIPNRIPGFSSLENETSNLGGKLTLEKVYFTYRNSNMGKYTPYKFDYGIDNNINNPNYHPKGFDIWGNYKNGEQGDPSILHNEPTTTELPFVLQDKVDADKNAQAWNLKSVALPSGGSIKIDIESDDYQFVQNKKAMQSYQIAGIGHTADIPPTFSNELYDGNHKSYLYINLGNLATSSLNPSEFKRKYLKDNFDKYIHSKVLMDIIEYGRYREYISGYFLIDQNKDIKIGTDTEGVNTYVSIPMKSVKIEKGGTINPITKTGLGFSRMFLNRLANGVPYDPDQSDFKAIVNGLSKSISIISEIFDGPNHYLLNRGCAKTINTNKSWVRLENSTGYKYGGGLRVKKITMSDDWQVMSEQTDSQTMNYGQEYSYESENGQSSSGVATFEPNESSENPFVEPFFPVDPSTYAEKMSAPKENNYVERPIGKSFFPSPTVTYSKVKVKDLKNDTNIRKNGTGHVIHNYYTSKDFPTEAFMSQILKNNDKTPNNIIKNLLSNGNISVKNHLTASQGFCVVTNDMNGKEKSQEVYQEGQTSPISKIEYKYNVENGKLNNELITISEKGEIKKKLIGLDSDMFLDFNESFSSSSVDGSKINVATYIIPAVPPFPLVLPTTFPNSSYNESLLRTATVTKHIHQTGILIEKIAYDLGSTVSTKNLAWDAQSGEVILTETVNEYDDKYYSFNYPAYWMYSGMANASQNIGIEGYVSRKKNCQHDPSPYFKVFKTSNVTGENETDIKNYFHVGDELLLYRNTGNQESYLQVWVMEVNTSNNGLLLMDEKGHYIDECGTNENKYQFKITRSGYRNLQSASMASVTSMINPMRDNLGNLKTLLDDNLFDFTGAGFNPRIINASAVVYKDFWKPQNESNFPIYPSLPGEAYEDSGEVNHPYDLGFNPYLWNIKGDWRAEKSYAYLAGRNSGDGLINNPRNEGFFTKFNSFYKLVNEQWVTNESNWTYASSISQYSPYGAELENKDALNRHSAAQYGYNYTLPTAVASNSKYNEMGFEGFEESITLNKKHFEFHGINTNLNISSLFSHTGRKSVKVTQAQPVRLKAKLQPTKIIAQDRPCSYQCNGLVQISGPFNITKIANTSPIACVLTTNDPYSPLFTNNIKGYTEWVVTMVCPNTDILISENFENFGELDEAGYKVTYTQISNTEIKIAICGGWYPSCTSGEINPNNYIEDADGNILVVSTNPINCENTFINIPIYINGTKLNLKYTTNHKPPPNFTIWTPKLTCQ